MKVIEIAEFGGPEVLTIKQRPCPNIHAGQVLIKVHAAGVNRPDILQRLGKYPPPEGVTDIPGLEVSGEIVHSKAPLWKKGDRVCALIAGGGYAEFAVASSGQCLPLPSNLNFIQGASLPEAIFTVWNNLIIRGQLETGQSVLIHGGSSGIGTMAIQISKALGALKIFVTAGSDDKCNQCCKLGADYAINYKDSDFKDEVNSITQGEGIDLVLDMVGGHYLPKNLSLLKADGRHVSIAFIAGINSTINIKEIMSKRLVLTGSTLRARPNEEKAELAAQIKKNIWPLIEKGTIKPCIYQTVPLDKASVAHQTMEKSEHFGKIILQVIK